MPTIVERLPKGLTKKEYFASVILQGLLARGSIAIDWCPAQAAQLARELIKELENDND